MITHEYFPHHTTQHFTENSALWRVMATDGTGYDTIANLLAAGKTLFPGPTIKGESVLVLNCENGSAASGSAFYFAYNKSTAPTDNTGIFIPAGQGFDAGGSFDNLWIRKTVATDEVVATVFY